ncbi:hypothetical protein [Mycobacterium sp. 1274756.6]|uniref:hypothetical protein n=1 Tax=Mycobacterium sp. 1274756.6 TaxID=1834076 RepID=UPI0007FCFD79|nr:hypothetical protein [Mycobacterium sp. 1274756.6]OBJ71016.1 hypothetical protein A5643_09005 [Mycobacterium sp. 1274756.6]
MTSLVGRTRLILLGDRDVHARRDELAQLAWDRGCQVVEAYGFEPYVPFRHEDLTHIDEVVVALAHAVEDRADVWVPWLMADFGRDQHLRRMILVLERHGRQLRAGRDLSVCEADGSLNEIDCALRAEVRAVENLANAVLAAAGMEKLSAEIEEALVGAGARVPERIRTVEAETGRLLEVPSPPLPPSPYGRWCDREPMLAGYARWLVHDCGVTRAATARVLNACGQRTESGKRWQAAAVRRLIDGETRP